MSSIGFWSPRVRSLIAVADDGRANQPMRATHTDEGCAALHPYFEAADGLDFELVTPEWLARVCGSALWGVGILRLDSGSR
jgi:hypothetical protein